MENEWAEKKCGVVNLDRDKGRVDLSRDWVRAGMECQIEREQEAGKVDFRIQTRTRYYSSY